MMATMNFNTANSTFRQLLANGLSYHVPPFQRDYSWTEDEWDDLWQDILGLFDADGEPAHYMGYLVLQSSDSKRFDIIDGQQRLTTISVMILAGLGHLQDLVTAGQDADDNAKRKEQLQNSYIGYLDPVSLVPRSKLELNRHNNRFYQTYLVPLERLPQRGLNASEHQLRKAFNWLKEKIKTRCGTTVKSGRDLASFLDKLVDKLFFTVITVTDELNAFKVFETLNARGVRLSATDLLKNYLFSIISTRDAAFELLRDLDRSAAVYAALRDPQDASWNGEEKQSIEQLQMFNVRQPLAMLMACYATFFDTDRAAFTRIIQAVTVVSFRYNVICNLQTHEQERLYNEIAKKVSNALFSKHFEVIAALP